MRTFHSRVTLISEEYLQTINENCTIYRVIDAFLIGLVKENVPYGTTPTYDGQTPAKQEDEHYTYEFSGWSPSGPITGETIFTPVFIPKGKPFSLTFKLYGGYLGGWINGRSHYYKTLWFTDSCSSSSKAGRKEVPVLGRLKVLPW